MLRQIQVWWSLKEITHRCHLLRKNNVSIRSVSLFTVARTPSPSASPQPSSTSEARLQPSSSPDPACSSLARRSPARGRLARRSSACRGRVRRSRARLARPRPRLPTGRSPAVSPATRPQPLASRSVRRLFAPRPARQRPTGEAAPTGCRPRAAPARRAPHAPLSSHWPPPRPQAARQRGRTRPRGRAPASPLLRASGRRRKARDFSCAVFQFAP